MTPELSRNSGFVEVQNQVSMTAPGPQVDECVSSEERAIATEKARRRNVFVRYTDQIYPEER
jgi:hypothetical protein